MKFRSIKFIRLLPFVTVLICTLRAAGQTGNHQLSGEWKSYLSDSSSFEFLKLNTDGTGVKCFGQTFNGKDSLFLNDVTALRITGWRVAGNKLFIESKNTVSFNVNPEYEFRMAENDRLELKGEHLILYLYPSVLNRKEFQRSVTYQHADKITGNYGVQTAPCISHDRFLFSFKPIDDKTQIAEYHGFDDLIPHLVGCHFNYEYAKSYNDPPYSLLIPNTIHAWSYGYGNKMFYISFDSDEKDSSETSVVIYYDFDNDMRDYYFSQIREGKEKKDIVNKNGLDIYKTKNWQGKYEGKVFLKNWIVIAYYTREKSLQEFLQKCITSFNYK